VNSNLNTNVFIQIRRFDLEFVRCLVICQENIRKKLETFELRFHVLRHHVGTGGMKATFLVTTTVSRFDFICIFDFDNPFPNCMQTHIHSQLYVWYSVASRSFSLYLLSRFSKLNVGVDCCFLVKSSRIRVSRRFFFKSFEINKFSGFSL